MGTDGIVLWLLRFCHVLAGLGLRFGRASKSLARLE